MEAALDGTSFGVDDAGAASVSSEAAAARRICCRLDDDLFVAEEEEEEVRRRRAVVHVDDANANDDAMFVSFSFCCVVDDERESDHLFFDDARCSISFAERKNAKFF